MLRGAATVIISTDMSKRISAPAIYFHKRIFPLVWIGIVAAVTGGGVLAMLNKGLQPQKSLAFFIVPTVLTLLGVLLYRKLVWDLVDEVYDAGDHLIVRNRGQEERVPLTNIMNVSVSVAVNPPRVTLRLVKPNRFGDEIAFMPVKPFSFSSFGRIPVADDLMVRVDRARMRRVE